jgi:heptose-I-phosphate ethanolaminephosphotransferase
LSTADDDSQYFRTKSIVSLAKEAGYKTWWLSAQSQYGKHETSVTSSGVDSDVKKYVEEGRTLSRTFDGVLVPLLEEGLRDETPQKFIVMHLYGSHISYGRRYPKDYAKFNDVPSGYENHNEKVQTKVNEYANSVAYTDFVLGEIIQKAEQKNEATCMVYIADHGEYLAENLEDGFVGHGGAQPHKVEVEVPLIVWCSQEYRQANPDKWQAIVDNANAPINLDDMFYALSDMMHIDYALMKQERSFFNAKFVPKLPRKTRSSSTGKVFNYTELR